MNSAQLLTHFDRISDAPESIPRLRRFILDLAVRGRLVEQHPARESVHNDYIKEPTSEEFPANWRILNFGKFCDIQGGNQPSKNQFVDEPRSGYIRLFQIRDLGENPVPTYIPKDTTNRFCRAGEILIGRYGASVGKIFWAQDGAYNVALAKFIYPQNAYVPHFAFLVLKSAVFQAKLTGSTRSAQAGFNKGDLADIALPLPPLAEQHRIVSKVDELMALCDRLKAAQAERENWRDRLVASSLNRLNYGAAAEVFRDHARFYFNHLPLLSTKPEHIQQLRQTILNLAVRGKLVPQDPNDEPASGLLKRIQTEKARLGKEGKRKQAVELDPVDDMQSPFTLPPSWVWARFPEIGIFGRGKSKHRPRNDRTLFVDGTHLLVQTGDVARSKGVIETHTSKYNDIGLAQSMKWPKGTLCITIAANIADSGILSFEACFPDSVVGFIPSSEFRSAKYFEYFIRTAKADLLAFAPATAQKNINLEILSAVLIPLPPLGEQQRIVTKVDELMALCDKLDAQLTTIHTDSRRLLESVLHEALAPAV